MSTDPSWLVSRPPELVAGDGFVLERAAERHADGLTEAIQTSLPELMRWLTWPFEGFSLDDTRRWLEMADEDWRTGRDFGYVILDGEEVVGSTGYTNRIGPGWLEIGLWIRTARAGEGFARRSTLLLADIAEQHLPEVEGLDIHHDVTHDASRAVAAACGFTLVGEVDPGPDRPFQRTREAVWHLPLHRTPPAGATS
ncbi:GNAT family N-acetyltransferase [Euzebya rosea]|uniref:GNAT family N-acetyltransferase n=1 Tax=Euzebya rosea TaxID=2052804 RepID=UPI000D3E4670|nr:GNAT family N-acetyltransferase [Euzebya rosea]